jgi:hypothetical protein
LSIFRCGRAGWPACGKSSTCWFRLYHISSYSIVCTANSASPPFCHISPHLQPVQGSRPEVPLEDLTPYSLSASGLLSHPNLPNHIIWHHPLHLAFITLFAPFLYSTAWRPFLYFIPTIHSTITWITNPFLEPTGPTFHPSTLVSCCMIVAVTWVGETMHQSAAVESITKELDKVLNSTTNNSNAACVCSGK